MTTNNPITPPTMPINAILETPIIVEDEPVSVTFSLGQPSEYPSTPL